jgi:hypothetical protein
VPSDIWRRWREAGGGESEEIAQRLEIAKIAGSEGQRVGGITEERERRGEN